MADAPTLSAVVPVFDGRHYLEQSLPPLLAAVGRELEEVVVVDDGSSDGSGEYARALGARVIPSGGRLGPGAARNLAIAEVRGEAVLLVDADVVIHADAPARARSVLAEPGVVAVFGSYDDAPPEPGFFSQYMNLRHHFTHSSHPGEATTFWSGCGAVRRNAFLDAGGFDTALFDRPSIEDIELGYRLRAAGGRILLDPSIRGTHLKRWSLAEVVRTDVFRRAVPWARLLLTRSNASADLNVGGGERSRAALAAGFWLALLAALLGAAPVWLPPALFAVAVALNRPLFALFRRRRGTPFALAALLYHQAYYVYAGAAYAYCWLEHRLRP